MNKKGFGEAAQQWPHNFIWRNNYGSKETDAIVRAFILRDLGSGAKRARWWSRNGRSSPGRFWNIGSGVAFIAIEWKRQPESRQRHIGIELKQPGHAGKRHAFDHESE